MANTKLCDFKNGFINIDGTPKKVILYNCPIAKQKFQTFRVEFNEIPLSWELDFDKDISAVADRSITLTEKLLGPLTLEQKKHVPLFCIERPTQVLRSEISRHSINTVLDGKILHNRAGVEARINNAFEDNSIFSISSERTGKILHLTARRLRHTHATKLAISGASIAEVANSLDHASYKAAMAYVNALPVLAIKIGEHLETTLSALAKRFDKNQVISVDTEKVIKLYTKHKSHDVGLCGKEVFCTEDYPIACYECELFIPSPFGNHKAVLNYVEDRIKEACEFGDFRGVENWRTIQIAVLERKFMADQVRLKMLSEHPEIKGLPYEGEK
ncbi:tyrosine-type recombinase/integrase [Aeromonas caviae]|uniref:tyrosine-type recombinase/integrase n=1 Tax=Aeromonas caviae TaxID=648 RepID=UPI0029DB6BB9|nr:tyrosine-type recombinase/integrase [Aeromonas caviae]MDX7677822.1 tyrosine-type recombinase/integrase [Aeromonas caviae]